MKESMKTKETINNSAEYNNMIADNKAAYIRSKKLRLLGTLMFMRVCQVASFLAVPAIMFIIWDKCFTNDVLYLCGWWICVGGPIAIIIAGFVGTAIKGYKRNELRRISKMAKVKYDLYISKED